MSGKIFRIFIAGVILAYIICPIGPCTVSYGYDGSVGSTHVTGVVAADPQPSDDDGAADPGEDGSEKQDENSQTGDPTEYKLYFAFMILSGLIVLIAAIRKKNRNMMQG